MFYSQENIMVNGIYSKTEIELRFDSPKLYEIRTFSKAGHLYPFLGDKDIETATVFVTVIDGVLHDCNDTFDFDGDIEDAIFSPLVRLSCKETADEISAFFGIDTSHIAIGCDDKILFREKFKAGYVFDPDEVDFVPASNAPTFLLEDAKKNSLDNWESAHLYNPTESW